MRLYVTVFNYTHGFMYTVNHGLIPYTEPMYASCIAEEVGHG